MEEYLKRARNDDWDDQESRDGKEILKIEVELWSTMYSGIVSALAAQDKIHDEVTSDSADEGDQLCQFFDGHDKNEVKEFAIEGSHRFKDSINILVSEHVVVVGGQWSVVKWSPFPSGGKHRNRLFFECVGT